MPNTNTRDVPSPDPSYNPNNNPDAPIGGAESTDTAPAPAPAPSTPTTTPTTTTPTTTTPTTTPEQQQSSTASTQSSKPQNEETKRKDNLEGSGVYMNHKYALVDEDNNDGIIITNAGKFKISVFLSPKFLSSEKIFTQKQNIFLKYNDVVTQISLVDDIDSIGLNGFITVKNIGSHLDVFLERHNNYYIIINFTKYQDDNGKEVPTIKYQPYIFDIEKVQNISNPQTEDKMLRIWLVDIITSILKNHSIASVIKFNKGLTSSDSYKDVFTKIMEYVRNYIKVNTNNKYEFHKPLLYQSNTYCFGTAKNGYDVGAGMGDLIKASFKRISKNASIKQALNVLLVDCCTTLKTPAGFKERYMTIGDVLIPFFFKEEYPDPELLYSSIWVNGQPKTTNNTNNTNNTNTNSGGAAASSTQPEQPTSSVSAQQPATTAPADTTAPASPPAQQPSTTSVWGRERDRDTTSNADQPISTSGTTSASGTTSTNNAASSTKGFWSTLSDGITELFKSDVKLKGKASDVLYDTSYGGKANVLVNRQMTMRDIYMPFFVTFGADDFICVYQDINPSKDNKQDNVLSLMGVYQGDLKSFQFNPIDMNNVSKMWKNVVFLDAANGATCTNSTLIFFSWFFDYFQEVFLNAVNKPLASNIMPDFFMFSRTQGIKHAAEQGNTFQNKFDQYNAYTYATQTQDSVKQCLRYMGKNLASFTLINDSYTFKLNGNLFRRPNEIIRLGYRGNKQGQGMQMVSYQTGLTFSDMTYLYVRKVTHIFTGATYDNLIQGCKICEVWGQNKNNKNIQKV